MKKEFHVWVYPNEEPLRERVLVTKCEYEADEMVMNFDARGIPATYKVIRK